MSRDTVSYDAVIVGSGPAGSSTAFSLARAGARVLMLDRARFPRDKPCAEYLSPQASGRLNEMGALSAIDRADSAQLAGVIVRAPNGAQIRGDFVASHGYRAFRDRGVAVRRTILDALLLSCARDAGAEVREGVRVTDLLRDARGRVSGVVVMRDGVRENLFASVVVGADGLRSVVSRRLALARTSRVWPRRIALVAHYENFGGITDWGEMHVEEEAGYVGFASVGGGLTNVSMVVPPKYSRDVSAGSTAFFESWLRNRPQLAPRLRHARLVSPVLATGPFASHTKRAWAPGVALVGDAADFFDPFTGEGIYSALLGGELLAPRIMQYLGAASVGEGERALAAYDRDRRAAFRGKWIVERLINAAVSWAPAINHFARTLSARKDMADLLVGVTGDFVPAREVLRPAYLLNLFRHASVQPPAAGA